jgi:integrase
MKTWTKTKIQGLMRHKTGNYYARLYLGNKEKWVSLRTDILEVAKSKYRTHDDVLAIRENQVRGVPQQAEPYTVGQAVGSYLTRLDNEVALDQLKPGTREYWKTVLNTIRRSWQEILKVDLFELQVTEVRSSDCKAWATAYRKTPSKRESRKEAGSKCISARYYNNSIFALRSVLAEAVKSGHLSNNPAKDLGVARIPATQLNLPTKEQFRAIVKAVRAGTHRTSNAAGDMIEFLAFSGTRVGEARRIQWKHINFAKMKIEVMGDPKTGTKNWGTRSVPIIPSMLSLLRTMEKRRNSTDSDEFVLKLRDVRGALLRGCEEAQAPQVSHHDLRHLFATVAIESSIDIPTVANWLGHKDGGALAMKTYHHLRDFHSITSATKVTF